MTLTINIDPELESRLQEQAHRQGVDAPEYARLLIQQGLERPRAAPPNRATLELLAQWDREDQTSDPAEIARREEELQEIKRSLNENRTSGRKPFPSHAFPRRDVESCRPMGSITPKGPADRRSEGA